MKWFTIWNKLQWFHFLLDDDLIFFCWMKNQGWRGERNGRCIFGKVIVIILLRSIKIHFGCMKVYLKFSLWPNCQPLPPPSEEITSLLHAHVGALVGRDQFKDRESSTLGRDNEPIPCTCGGSCWKRPIQRPWIKLLAFRKRNPCYSKCVGQYWAILILESFIIAENFIWFMSKSISS